MGFLHWLQENWLDLFQTAAIVSGFVAMGRDRRKEKVQNRIYFTERHGELSRRETYDTKLARISLATVDLKTAPLTPFEENHVRQKFHHLAATFYATRNGVYTQPSALPEDIRSYLSLPIPKAVWRKTKKFLDPDFITFVEGYMSE